jgi:hypothetical protein
MGAIGNLGVTAANGEAEQAAGGAARSLRAEFDIAPMKFTSLRSWL